VKVRRAPYRMLEQRGLADTWLATHDQDPAVAAASGAEQPFDDLSLALTTQQAVVRQPDR
jgi:hypothetical protein